MRVLVLHASYGCETGCCGHSVEIYNEAGTLIKEKFDFSHPKWQATPEEIKDFIRKTVTEEVGEKHVADIDWDNCRVSEN